MKNKYITPILVLLVMVLWVIAAAPNTQRVIVTTTADTRSFLIGGPTTNAWKISTNTNARAGSAILAGMPGTIVVANTNVTASSLIFLTRALPGGTLGYLSYTKIAATSFTILSTGNETSTVNYWIIETQ